MDDMGVPPGKPPYGSRFLVMYNYKFGPFLLPWVVGCVLPYQFFWLADLFVLMIDLLIHNYYC